MGGAQRVQHTRLVVVRQQAHRQLQGAVVLLLAHRSAEQQSHGLHQRNVYLDVQRLAGERGEGLLWSVERGVWRVRQSPECPLQQRFDALCREVATEHQPHVVGHIVAAEEILHVLQPRVLQVLRAADDGILVGMSLEGLRHHPLHGSRDEVVGGAVLLFVHRLQFALEQPEHGVQHPLRVEPAPLFQELRCERVVILRHVVRCRGVQPRTAVSGDEPVKLVGDGVVRRPLAQSADVLLKCQSPCCVLGLRQLVVLSRDRVEPHALRLIVHRANLLRTLEQHVLQVVRNTRVRTVLGPRLHHHGPVDLRLRVVLVQPDSQPVLQLQFLHVQPPGRRSDAPAQRQQNQDISFHLRYRCQVSGGNSFSTFSGQDPKLLSQHRFLFCYDG